MNGSGQFGARGIWRKQRTGALAFDLRCVATQNALAWQGSTANEVKAIPLVCYSSIGSRVASGRWAAMTRSATRRATSMLCLSPVTWRVT